MLTSTFQSIHPNSNRNWFINWFQLELVIWNFQHRKLFYKCLDKYPKLQTDVSNTERQEKKYGYKCKCCIKPKNNPKNKPL